MFFIKIYIKESYMNYYDTSIQMCGQYCILNCIRARHNSNKYSCLQNEFVVVNRCLVWYSQGKPCFEKVDLIFRTTHRCVKIYPRIRNVFPVNANLIIHEITMEFQIVSSKLEIKTM